MNNFKIFTVLLAAIVFSVAMTSTAFAGRQDFILVNQTGRPIINIYITPTHSYYWNDDILEEDILPNGESAHINFHRSETDRYWAMMVTFDDGNDYVYDGIDLFSISQITLRYDGMAIQE